MEMMKRLVAALAVCGAGCSAGCAPAPRVATSTPRAREGTAVVEVHAVAAASSADAGGLTHVAAGGGGASGGGASAAEANAGGGAPTPEPEVECKIPSAAAPNDLCGLVELTGAAPCEWDCRVDGARRPGAKSGKSYRVIFDASGKKPRELLRIENYDGPFPIVDPQDFLMRSVHTFIDKSTTPPTLENRDGSCFFPAARDARNRAPAEPTEAHDAAARKACSVLARYRFDGGSGKFTKLP